MDQFEKLAEAVQEKWTQMVKRLSGSSPSPEPLPGEKPADAKPDVDVKPDLMPTKSEQGPAFHRERISKDSVPT